MLLMSNTWGDIVDINITAIEHCKFACFMLQMYFIWPKIRQVKHRLNQ